MPRFQCVPIAAATVTRFRDSGIDDRGNAVIAMHSAAGPCRNCLCNATSDQPLLLGSYDLPAPRGIYWTPSPVFVHADDCPRFARPDAIAPIIRGRLVSVRSYDAAGMCLYDLGEVCDGDAVEGPLFRALDDSRTRIVNVHTARPGCLLCAVVRSGAELLSSP